MCFFLCLIHSLSSALHSRVLFFILAPVCTLPSPLSFFILGHRDPFYLYIFTFSPSPSPLLFLLSVLSFTFIDLIDLPPLVLCPLLHLSIFNHISHTMTAQIRSRKDNKPGPAGKDSLPDDQSFLWTYTEEPHLSRRKAIIAKHPEVSLCRYSSSP